MTDKEIKNFMEEVRKKVKDLKKNLMITNWKLLT